VFRREDLKAIIDDLEQFGTVTLGKLEKFTGTTDSPLTDRQRVVVTEALTRGYYDWPRQINNEDLASELDISRATLHEHLRRAEKTLLSAGIPGEKISLTHRGPVLVASELANGRFRR
jgi:predicted DNA binding protein